MAAYEGVSNRGYRQIVTTTRRTRLFRGRSSLISGKTPTALDQVSIGGARQELRGVRWKKVGKGGKIKVPPEGEGRCTTALGGRASAAILLFKRNGNPGQTCKRQ